MRFGFVTRATTLLDNKKLGKPATRVPVRRLSHMPHHRQGVLTALAAPLLFAGEEQVELLVEFEEKLLPCATRVETLGWDRVPPHRWWAMLRVDAEGSWWSYPSVQHADLGEPSTDSLVFVPFVAGRG